VNIINTDSIMDTVIANPSDTFSNDCNNDKKDNQPNGNRHHRRNKKKKKDTIYCVNEEEDIRRSLS
jgi:hypothetical protein